MSSLTKQCVSSVRSIQGIIMTDYSTIRLILIPFYVQTYTLFLHLYGCKNLNFEIIQTQRFFLTCIFSTSFHIPLCVQSLKIIIIYELYKFFVLTCICQTCFQMLV